MGTKRRTEITVETHRIMVIRAPHRQDEGWCERCGKQTARLSLPTATQAGVSAEQILRHIDAGRLHFTGSGDDLRFICLTASTTQERKLLR
jgi:hypothetical protein